MTVLPIDPTANPSPEGLRNFISDCKAEAVKSGHGRLVSITIEVEPLDPLAVLESIFEPSERHFYVERPSEDWALAGAEAVLSFTAEGPGRFEACQAFIDETLAGAISVGDSSAPFAGPHFFLAHSFFSTVGAKEPFEASSLFVPRWQVARREGRTVAVASFVVDAATPIGGLTEKVWRAHSKFRAFDYQAPAFDPAPVAIAASVAEVGGAAHYPQSVRTAVDLISRGEFEKIVLARAKDVSASETLHPLRVLNGLRQRFFDCYAFSLSNGRGQSFIGASPERLLRVRGGVALTEALAGSTRRGASASEDVSLGSALARSEKDLREQRIVLNSIVRRLAPLGLPLEFPEKPGIKRLANVQHLHTPVRAVLPKQVRLLDLLGRLHPTPAVGGTPREAAMLRIPDLEGFERGLYAGALGWVDSRGDGEFFVGLRSALIEGNKARLYAGAGIVAGSNPDKEFAETELKFKAMEEALIPK